MGAEALHALQVEVEVLRRELAFVSALVGRVESLEREVYTPTALPEPDSFVASESVSGTSDNFTWIRGIGDAKEQRLHAAGYLTYDLFLNANVEELASLLDVSSSTVVRMMDAIQERKGDVSSWPVAVAVPVQGT